MPWKRETSLCQPLSPNWNPVVPPALRPVAETGAGAGTAPTPGPEPSQASPPSCLGHLTALQGQRWGGGHIAGRPLVWRAACILA